MEEISISYKGKVSKWTSDDDGVVPIYIHEVPMLYEVGVQLQAIHKSVSRRSRSGTLEVTHDCNAQCVGRRFADCSNCWPLHLPFRLLNQSFPLCPGPSLNGSLMGYNTVPLGSQASACNRTGTYSDEDLFKSLCEAECGQKTPPCQTRTFAPYTS